MQRLWKVLFLACLGLGALFPSLAAAQGAAITSPAAGSAITSGQAFQWNDAAADGYQLWLGTTPGGYDLGAYPSAAQLTMATSITVPSLPDDGRPIYATLWSRIGGAYFATNAAYASTIALATLTSPAAGSVLPGTLATFQWNAGSATAYQLWVGTTPGGLEVGAYPSASDVTTATSLVVPNLPSNGAPLYVTLWQLIGGRYQSTSAAYVAASGPGSASVIFSPADGSTLTSSSALLKWNDSGASAYDVLVGTTAGASDRDREAAGTARQLAITNLPTDGSMIHVRLVSHIGGTAFPTDVAYTAADIPPPAVITSPSDASTLAGTSATFQWNAAASGARYQLWLGTRPGTYDVGAYPSTSDITTGTSLLATGIPTNGGTVYATLWSMIGGVYYSTAASYSTSTAPAAMFAPANGSTLGGAAETFRWNNAGASSYQVWIGTTPGANDLGSYALAGSVQRLDVTGLPANGAVLYVRLWSDFGGTSSFTDTSYTESSASLDAATMLSPTPSSTLGSPSQLFQWTAGGASMYQLWIGTTPGSANVGAYPSASQLTSATSLTASGLPMNGQPLYVRLVSLIGGAYYFHDYVYSTVLIPAPGNIVSPLNNATLLGGTATFTWTGVGVSGYQLWIGSAPGASDLGIFPAGNGLTMQTSATITGLPVDGRKVYVRLWSAMGGTYVSTDAQYGTALAGCGFSPLPRGC